VAGVDGQNNGDERDQGHLLAPQPQNRKLGSAREHGDAHQRRLPGFQPGLDGCQAEGDPEDGHKDGNGKELNELRSHPSRLEPVVVSSGFQWHKVPLITGGRTGEESTNPCGAGPTETHTLL